MSPLFLKAHNARCTINNRKYLYNISRGYIICALLLCHYMYADTTDTTRYQTTNYEIIIITERSAGVNNNNTIILLHL